MELWCLRASHGVSVSHDLMDLLVEQDLVKFAKGKNGRSHGRQIKNDVKFRNY